jgi:hypothetical protein
MNAYVRSRLALTESSPLVRDYDENAWAELADAKTGPTAPSVSLLEGLHARWAAILSTLTDQEFARTFKHPAMGEISLDTLLCVYAWHSKHHVAQITGLRERSRW